MLNNNQKNKLLAFRNLFTEKRGNYGESAFDIDGLASKDEKKLFNDCIFDRKSFKQTAWDVNRLRDVVDLLLDKRQQKKYGSLEGVIDKHGDIANHLMDKSKDVLSQWGADPKNHLLIKEAAARGLIGDENSSPKFDFLKFHTGGQYIRIIHFVDTVCEWLSKQKDVKVAGAEIRAKAYSALVRSAMSPNIFNPYKDDETGDTFYSISCWNAPEWLKGLVDDCHERKVEIPYWTETGAKDDFLHESRNEWRVKAIRNLFVSMQKWGVKEWGWLDNGSIRVTSAYHDLVNHATDLDSDSIVKWFNDRQRIRRHWVNMWLNQVREMETPTPKDTEIIEVLAKGQWLDVDDMAQRILALLRKLNP